VKKFCLEICGREQAASSFDQAITNISSSKNENSTNSKLNHQVKKKKESGN